MFAILKTLAKKMSGGGECCGGKPGCSKNPEAAGMKTSCGSAPTHDHGHHHHHHHDDDEEDSTTPGKGGCCG